jgi:transcriptional regulator with PAS, ATPase and Fis domain
MNRVNIGQPPIGGMSSDVAGLFGPNGLSDHASTPSNWRDSFPEIIGRSQGLLKVLEFVSRVAKSDCAVMIYGESGTGKELIANALHRLSNRSDRRFVALNCSAIPENLLETELFGHEKGAFTGAVAKRQGVFDVARNGTLFLDEIGDMSAALQVKLLRVLQEKKFTPVGGTESRDADVRIVVATNVNLEQAVREQRFRLDLYYRINVIPIELPPLRERLEDLPDLVNHFVNVSNRVHCPERPRFLTEALVRELQTYSWPGNIRELQNLIERLIVTAPNQGIDVGQLPSEYRSAIPTIQGATHLANAPVIASHEIAPASHNQMPLQSRVDVTFPQGFGMLPNSGIDLTKFMEDLENSFIRQALDRTNNNKNQAAKLLGINRTTLVERLKKRRIGTPRSNENDGSDL